MMSESEVPKKRFTADRTRLFPSEWKFRRFSRSYEPFDSRSPFQTSGLRFGTPAITTRGLKEDKMDYIVGLIDRVLHDPENEANIAAVRKDVNALMADYPLFAW